jgi:hypothetical protein
MTRLYDRIRPDLDETVQHEILDDGKYSTVVFDITNVARYLEANEKQYSDLSDFPNVAPPFGCYWMEWRRRPHELLPFARVGALVLATNGATDALPNGARWSIAVIPMIEGRRGRSVPLGQWTLLVSETGGIEVYAEEVFRASVDLFAPLRRSDAVDGPVEMDPEDAAIVASGDRERAAVRVRELEALLLAAESESAAAREELDAAIDAYYAKASATLAPYARSEMLFPVLLAHSLMACKNVTKEEQEPPERLSRSHERKKGRALVRFWTLVIDPMGGGRSSGGERVSLGDGMTALHIVRGHFKTYTRERPLFGTYVGTYWWSPTARGKSENGVVVKDYAMSPPLTPLSNQERSSR